MAGDGTYYWKPTRVKPGSGLTTANVMGNGRGDRDISRRTVETITYSKHGIVYSFAEPHNDKVFRKHPYYCYHSMMYDQYLWRGRSWGGNMTPQGMRTRANTFARNVAIMSRWPSEDVELLQTQSLINQRDKLAAALAGVIDLVLAWMNGILARVGVSWSCEEDYPPAIKTGMQLLREVRRDNE